MQQSCSRPSACPSTTLTDPTGGNSSKVKDPFASRTSGKKQGEINSGFKKDKKNVSRKDKGTPFGYDPLYQYPRKKKEEKGLFSPKVMKSWKKY